MSTGKAIGLNYARQLAKNYLTGKLGKPLLLDDTEGVWFSKQMILSALGLDPETVTKEVTGIRFYFGAYETEPGFPENSFDNNKLTLIMVPTGDESIEITRGTETETAFKDRIAEPDPGQPTQPSYPSFPGGIVPEQRYFNEGQLAPPPFRPDGLGLLNW